MISSRNKANFIIVAIVYMLVIIIQLGSFIPYVKTETYISAQNVPHTIVVDRGYSSFEYADNYTATDNKGVTTRRRINYPLAVIQFLLTTATAVLVCYLLYKREVISEKNENAIKIDVLKKQNIKLQQTIDDLSSQINKTTLENEALRDQLAHFTDFFDKPNIATQNSFVDEQVSLNNVFEAEPPYIDINALAFADDDEIRNAQKQYAEDLYKYFKAKERGVKK